LASDAHKSKISKLHQAINKIQKKEGQQNGEGSDIYECTHPDELVKKQQKTYTGVSYLPVLRIFSPKNVQTSVSEIELLGGENGAKSSKRGYGSTHNRTRTEGESKPYKLFH